MARKIRLQYPCAVYHLMSRGHHREPVFLEDDDRRKFLSTLAEACAKTDWQVHVCCLMNNHFLEQEGRSTSEADWRLLQWA
jgi:REP element-mobilizing transposase RayT